MSGVLLKDGWALSLSTAPTTEPVLLQEVKDYMRVTINDDDALIMRLMKASRDAVETMTNRQLITATWVLRLNDFQAEIPLPRAPLSSVTSVQYIDSNNTTQTLAGTVYTTDTNSEPGRIYEAYGQSWPATLGVRHSVTITYVAGYGGSDDVPVALKQAVMAGTLHLYENRGDPCCHQQLDAVLRDMALPYKVWDF